MTTQVTLCNLGLAALGEKAFINSLDENSPQARYANLFYEPARKSVLRAHPWNFAKGRVSLALIGDGPTPWEYQYAVPSNCLKARYIEGGYVGQKIEFEVALDSSGAQRVINTNQQEATLVYTVDVSNTAFFDALFVDMFAARMAMLLAPVLAPNKAGDMERRYAIALRSAQAVDAGEGYEEHDDAPEWLEARISGVEEIYTRAEVEG